MSRFTLRFLLQTVHSGSSRIGCVIVSAGALIWLGKLSHAVAAA